MIRSSRSGAMATRTIATLVVAGTVALFVSIAAAQDVVLAPSALPGTCIFKPGKNGIRPLATGCVDQNAKGVPVFSPDGQMLYLVGQPDYGSTPAFAETYPTQVFARDPQTGKLSALPCKTASGGTRCPPDNRA